jgi:regulator of RNase E activity RraA
MPKDAAAASQWPHYDDELKLFDGLSTAVISDAIDSLKLPNTVMAASVRPVAGNRLIGRARTLTRIQSPVNADQQEIAPKLSLAAQDLIDSCVPGDVIVVAFSGESHGAIWGDNMCERARGLGVNGIVTNGAVRDVETMRKVGFPTFAGSVTPRQSVGRVVTVAMDEPVICGGVSVQVNDIIVGDADGVAVIPRAHSKAIAAEAQRIEAVEANVKAFLRDGNSIRESVVRFKQR